MANGTRLTDRVAWRILAGVYLVLFGSILWVSHGLPYAIDNNESFSSLLHARNLHEVSWALTKGLTDEVEAYHPAASPYVHTHQGNVPRIFAYVIYLLGARSIESQIAITTMIVGLLAVWLAYRFARSIGPPVFALIVCLVLVTDYGLFGQWQVDTYRVWYGFFFFASLLWVSAFGQRRGPLMIFAGLSIFAAMFYGEYVFATFVGLTTGCYGCIRYRTRLGVIVRILLIECAGGAIAGATLMAQLTAYMGWENVKRDIRYTLSARNMALDPTFAAKATRFYAEHHIIFFGNYYDATPKRTVGQFLSALFTYQFQFYSSWIFLSLLVLLLGIFLGALCVRNRGWVDPSTNTAFSWRYVCAFVAFTFGLFYLAYVAQFGVDHGFPHFLSSTIGKVTLAGSMAFIVFWIVRLRSPRPLTSGGVTWSAILRGSVLLSAAIYLLHSQQRLFGLRIEHDWRMFIDPKSADCLGAVCFAGCTIFAMPIASFGSGLALDSRNVLLRLVELSAAVLVSFAFVYRIFTGYIFSGYLVRQAPFLVFWTDFLVGAGCFFLADIGGRQIKLGRALPVLGSSILLTVFAGAWVALQVTYWSVVPSTRYSFLHLLNKAPFLGKTFVVDTYPAPVSEETRSWAYAESSIFSGQLRLGPAGFSTDHDTKYLWFADAASNRSYLRPDFGIKIVQPASMEVALGQWTTSEPESSISGKFESAGIIERSREPIQAFIQDELFADDKRNFAIVKFDWDYPPFLRKIDSSLLRAAASMTLGEKMGLSSLAAAFHRNWRVEIEPIGSGSGNSTPSVDRLISEATIDGGPIFTPESLKATNVLSKLVEGRRLHLRLRPERRDGLVRVSVNEMTKVFDLREATTESRDITFSDSTPYGKHTFIPNFSPGVFVTTELHRSHGKTIAQVAYRYAQQDENPEEDTTIRIFNKDPSGKLNLVDSVTYLGSSGTPVRIGEFRQHNSDVFAKYSQEAALGDHRTFEQWLIGYLAHHPDDLNRPGVVTDRILEPLRSGNNGSSTVRYVQLPEGLRGWCDISVTPGTRSKRGTEYFGLPFEADESDILGNGGRILGIESLVPKPGQLPYGLLRLRLRFPTTSPLQHEPIVQTGTEGAGDFLYAFYPDSRHIQFGFDHWFIGGPITPPLPIDYSKEHVLEISMGSLFPPSEDILFVGFPDSAVSDIKSTLHVVLDGVTVLDAKVDFCDSTPEQLLVGQNSINGSTSNPLFLGTIVGQDRVWPTSLVPQPKSALSK